MISKYGYPYIALLLTVGVILVWLDDLSPSIIGQLVLILNYILLCFVVYFFRDPWRRVSEEPGLIVAPADGKIMEIKEVDLNGQPSIQIIIFLSVFNVHINRIPYAGEIISTDYKKGKFHAAYKKGIQEKNERMEILMNTDQGVMKVVQMAGLIARKIVCKLQPAQIVATGEKFGMIKFGSRTDLYVPRKAHILVKEGQSVNAGLTILGKFQ
ncbi:phosphatidylserine decarboxylase [bacterium]|nr:phosphatidylserine decarboxylase [bacterium]MBT4552781.1 phosphatidylserine decarboxylase [bacterium]MBT7087379.1 phosphatidylserine decarboxylase [bacterium]